MGFLIDTTGSHAPAWEPGQVLERHVRVGAGDTRRWSAGQILPRWSVGARVKLAGNDRPCPRRESMPLQAGVARSDGRR
jgi:hypothetical protein